MTYRGVALFGDPGIGKSTIGALLHELVPKSVQSEGADVLYRIAGLDAPPERFDELLEALRESNMRVKPSRVDAKRLFERVNEMYGDDAVARVIIAEDVGEEPLIVTGPRGLANARRFQDEGYCVVYLRAVESLAAQRLVERDGIPLDAAIEEVQLERKLFQNDEIEIMADVIVDLADKNSQDVAYELAPIIVNE
ncbi:MAG: hypothetical protein UY72_C0027G0009 [Candidatus Uhrbacteria bacterium GW2011_GWD2_52_7]|uniref:Adenylate kinase n=1 Tax=Candidatus Uhrbacteria bacterium GW2011_GWD2_52_7 TaxID=1618989 RepID=A0A0G1XFD5_9BACT|nr:MAG: hypothetical protein UY72_C0027G0009 [Candidatus Uhrbacteria bacterium GW2011_GWD2_52_7]